MKSTTPKHNHPKRAGGEKRGNKYDRAARLSRLSMAQDNGAPVVVVAVPSRRRVKGAWIAETRDMPIRQWNNCAHCEIEISCHPSEREDSTIRAEQDRIDPDGGYTLDNLQLLCRRCNEQKSDRFIG